jgi:hypothetical protein
MIEQRMDGDGGLQLLHAVDVKRHDHAGEQLVICQSVSFTGRDQDTDGADP